MPSKVCDLITHPFTAIEVWEWISIFAQACNYLSILGLKLAHVTKKALGVYPTSVRPPYAQT